MRIFNLADRKSIVSIVPCEKQVHRMITDDESHFVIITTEGDKKTVEAINRETGIKTKVEKWIDEEVTV